MARGNKWQTQNAINKIEEFLELGEERFAPAEFGNTAVHLEHDGDLTALVVTLHGNPIVEMVFDGSKFYEVDILDGNFYDAQGRASRTTRERQNGILDFLGEQCLIPEGVRVFLDKETGEAKVGRQAISRPYGKGYEPVTILAHPVKLEFAQ